MRFSLARERRGITKRALAKKINVAEQLIAAYENGKAIPEIEIIKKIALVLSFPVDFFFADEVDKIFADIASFRPGEIKSVSQRNMALSVIHIALLVTQWLEERFDIVEPDFPKAFRLCKHEKTKLQSKQSPANTYEDCEAAAETLRCHWLLGWNPIGRMIALLESKGVRIFALPENIQEIGSFSFWYENKPFIFLDTRKAKEDLRFDAAHELGHLILHRHGSPLGQEAEKEANTFASAFLMPKSDIQTFPLKSLWTKENILAVKKRWGVSAADLIHRLFWLDRMPNWLYRDLQRDFKVLSDDNKTEPSPYEMSKLFEKVFSLLRAEGITKNDIANDLHIHPKEIDELIFGLTLTVLQGRSNKSDPNKSRPNLKLI